MNQTARKAKSDAESRKHESSDDLLQLAKGASKASDFLKAMAHELRLQTICFIGEGERSVHEIEVFLGTSQSNISQHLGKMKDKGVLVCRKEGNQCFYSVKDPTTLRLVKILRDCFCETH